MSSSFQFSVFSIQFSVFSRNLNLIMSRSDNVLCSVAT